MVYHSSFVDDEGITKACGCPLLPLKSHIKGPAPVSDQDRTDIVDEAITFFRANVFFRNFDIKSSADKLLIYLTFYINVALKRLEGCRTLAEGTKAIINLGLENVPVPGESGFPFPGLFSLPQSNREAELFRNYLKQIREETSGRLLSVAYRPNGTPNKWWLAFAKRKFMNIIVPWAAYYKAIQRKSPFSNPVYCTIFDIGAFRKSAIKRSKWLQFSRL